ncbi:MAG: hypothetical protein ACFFBE_11795 [Promethearchaeota archaeon]
MKSGITFDLDFTANAIVSFSGWLEALGGADWYNFGFRLDDQDVIRLIFMTWLDSRDVFYSHIFCSIQPGSHKISFYCMSTVVGRSLSVPIGPRYAYLSITITI